MNKINNSSPLEKSSDLGFTIEENRQLIPAYGTPSLINRVRNRVRKYSEKQQFFLPSLHKRGTEGEFNLHFPR